MKESIEADVVGLASFTTDNIVNYKIYQINVANILENLLLHQ